MRKRGKKPGKQFYNLNLKEFIIEMKAEININYGIKLLKNLRNIYLMDNSLL